MQFVGILQYNHKTFFNNNINEYYKNDSFKYTCIKTKTLGRITIYHHLFFKYATDTVDK